MPRKDTFPGTIYAQKGRNKWIIKLPGMKPVHTGLEATPENKKIARQIRERMWLESKGIGKKASHDVTTYDVAFAQFLRTYCATLSEASKTQYIAAYKTIAKEAKALTVANVEADVLAYLKTASNHSQVTRNNYLRRFQTFLTWCEKRYSLPHTDFSKKYRKKETVTVETYEEWECAAILDYCQDHDSDNIREMGVMIEFMLETGARLTDCLNLTPQAVKGGQIAFRNKVTKETELLPITDKAQKLLTSLPKRAKSVFRWQAASTSRLRKYLYEAMRACNIEQRNRSFQEFRTTFRNRLLDAGVQPEITMRLMRHRDMRTTMKHYTKFTDEAMKNALKKASFGSEKVA
jgi:integrase